MFRTNKVLPEDVNNDSGSYEQQLELNRDIFYDASNASPNN